MESLVSDSRSPTSGMSAQVTPTFTFMDCYHHSGILSGQMTSSCDLCIMHYGIWLICFKYMGIASVIIITPLHHSTLETGVVKPHRDANGCAHSHFYHLLGES